MTFRPKTTESSLVHHANSNWPSRPNYQKQFFDNFHFQFFSIFSFFVRPFAADPPAGFPAAKRPSTTGGSSRGWAAGSTSSPPSWGGRRLSPRTASPSSTPYRTLSTKVKKDHGAGVLLAFFSGGSFAHNMTLDQSCQVWPFRGQKTNVAFFKNWLASKFLIVY